MVDDALEDLLEVEAAADVGRDAPERLGPMELVGDLRRRRRGGRDLGDACRRDADQLAVAVREGLGRGGHGDEHAPGATRAGDRAGELAALVERDRQRCRRPAIDDGARPVRPHRVEGLGEDPVAPRHLHEPASARARDRRRHEAVAVEAPRHHEGQARQLANDANRVSERRLGVRHRGPEGRRGDLTELHRHADRERGGVRAENGEAGIETVGSQRGSRRYVARLDSDWRTHGTDGRPSSF
jgi:hypothetical protein